LNVGSSLSIATTPTAVFSVFANTGMSASKAGTFEINAGAYSATTGVFTAAATPTGAEEYLQVTFTDATSSNTTNTIIKVSDALEGTVADGSSFTLNLSAAGLGTYSFAASAVPGETFDDAEFIMALDGATVETTASGATGDGSMKVQVGANEGDQLAIAIGKMDAASLSLDMATITLQEDAGKAITLTRAAINTVSSQRASLGALQNRLQHKINNLDTSAENLQAAESRIRDLDMAKEMTTFTKNNILVQASTSMLAQANAAPQAVLKLLQ
jgi:flagellin